MQFRVVNRVLYSFDITYLHNNSYIVWENGAPDGICYYSMGLPLGVITDPVDADWNWSDVELADGYDRNFTFNPIPDAQGHTKLFLTPEAAAGETISGVQVKFRLKWDHNKSSIIYVDHN